MLFNNAPSVSLCTKYAWAILQLNALLLLSECSIRVFHLCSDFSIEVYRSFLSQVVIKPAYCCFIKQQEGKLS